MTKIYFVRHAEPIHSWKDDRTRPLSQEGDSDSKKVTEYFRNFTVDAFISSPYKRSMDTIAGSASQHGMLISTDERFRERQQGGGYKNFEMIRKRWSNFDYCEEGGETLNQVQKRNIEALNEILSTNKDKSIVIGTHGTALSTILNHYDTLFNIDSFFRIIDFIPYILRLDFEGVEYMGSEELLIIEKPYNP